MSELSMIAVLFWVTLAVYLCQAFWSIVIKRRVVGLNLFALTGVYLPALMNSFGWSTFSDTAIDERLYLIMFYLNIGLIVYNLLCRDRIPKMCITLIGNLPRRVIAIVNVMYIAFYLLENYLGSQSLWPALDGIDIHTYAFPVIGYVTRSIYAFVLVDWLAYATSRKRRYLIWIGALLLIPVITRNMRIVSFVGLLQVAAFAYALRPQSMSMLTPHGKELRGRRRRAAVGAAAALLVVGFVFYSAVLTNERMSHYGRYDIEYKNEIGYVGPESPGDVLGV